MPDYKEMYLKMVRASEEAIRIIIKAQQECEELYLTADEAAEKDGCRECRCARDYANIK